MANKPKYEIGQKVYMIYDNHIYKGEIVQYNKELAGPYLAMKVGGGYGPMRGAEDQIYPTKESIIANLD